MTGYKSRKLWFASGVFIVVSAELAAHLLPAEVYATIVIAVITAYMVGNVGDKFAPK